MIEGKREIIEKEREGEREEERERGRERNLCIKKCNGKSFGLIIILLDAFYVERERNEARKEKVAEMKKENFPLGFEYI